MIESSSSLDQALRFFFALLIMLSYANNVLTGMVAIVAAGRHLPTDKNRRRKTMIHAFWFAILRTDKLPTSSNEVRLIERTQNYFMPYISIPLAVLGLMAHANWFFEREYTDQFGLYGFAIVHLGTAWVIHGMHKTVYLTSKDEHERDRS